MCRLWNQRVGGVYAEIGFPGQLHRSGSVEGHPDRHWVSFTVPGPNRDRADLQLYGAMLGVLLSQGGMGGIE